MATPTVQIWWHGNLPRLQDDPKSDDIGVLRFLSYVATEPETFAKGPFSRGECLVHGYPYRSNGRSTEWPSFERLHER
ncbi:MAG: hypothetical protein DMG96_39550 [Acidobacteria bacterium]|nr:MAG: hypothetical protein DMG96_39550 [Acidobacteriota bacterium]